jgi:hypothetical protein
MGTAASNTAAIERGKLRYGTAFSPTLLTIATPPRMGGTGRRGLSGRHEPWIL